MLFTHLGLFVKSITKGLVYDIGAMAYPRADTTSRSTHAWWTPAVERRVVGVALAGLLGLAILNHAVGGPEWLVAWHVTAAFLVVASGLVIVNHFEPASRPDHPDSSGLVPLHSSDCSACCW